jgi:DNA-binding MarR family transcriptional regulator
MRVTHRDAAKAMTADCLCFRSRRAARTLTRVYDDELRATGLQATQLTLLNAVAMHEPGGAPLSELARILALDATTLSRNLRPLERAGLLRIARSPTDRRARLAHLTRAGQRAVARALPSWKRAHRRIAEALGAETSRELCRWLDKVAVAGALLQMGAS